MVAQRLLPARSFQFQAAAASPRVTPAPSLELTSSDGVGLALVSLSARIVICGPLAFTELTLVFANPQPRQIEGRFRVALPSGAAVSRFAMRIGAQWQEGEVVERQAARRAYEDFLHRRQDPALLEHEAGNEFSARVFPIEANSRKEIIVSYSHELVKAGDPYRLPLLGLPRIESLDIRALVGRAAAAQGATSSLGGTATSWQVVEARKSGWVPDVDFEVQPPSSEVSGLRHENLAVVRVLPDLPAEPDEIPSLLVLLDTSASRALGHDRQIEVLAQLAAGLALGAGPETPLAVACFDQSVDLIFNGHAGDFSPVHSAKIRARLALGASDLAGALRWASAGQAPRHERVLLVTDGVATAGETEAEKIAAAAGSLSAVGVKRLDVLAVGGLRDDAALRRLVTAGLERDGTVCDGDLPLPEIAARLTRATKSGIAVSVPGASWVWPTRLDALQPGDAALIYCDVPAGQPVSVLLDGAPVSGAGALDSVERPLLERAWIKARIERLEEMRARPDADPDVRAGLQKQIVDLSVKHRVLCPYTALLVLETEADYERFQIDRNALADILTVGLSGIEVMHRTSASVPAPEPAKAPPPPPVRSPLKKKARPPVDAMRSMPGPAAEEREAGFSEDAPVAFSEDAGADGEGGSNDMRTRAGTLSLRSLDMPAAQPEAAFAPADEVDDLADLSAGALEEQTITPRREMSAPEPSFAAPAPAPSFAAPPPPPPPGYGGPPPAPPPPPPAIAARPAPVAQEAPSLLRRIASAATDVVSRITGSEPAEAPRPPAEAAPPPPQPPPPSPLDSWTGTFREVMELVLDGKGAQALDAALTWRQTSPGDLLALIAIGEAAELTGDLSLAARAYGSLIDLYPSRADLRRFAGERLSRLGARGALDLAIDTYRKAVASRPDHPSGHRLLGMALLRAGRFAEAFDAIATGQARTYADKFPGIPRILTEDLGLAAAAYLRADPSKRNEILSRLARAGARLEDEPSVRFVLVWETDANDVDFHIHDALGGHAYFREKVLPSGGELYADVTQGYGPECFTIRGAPSSRAYPYRLQAHYYRQGPMGFGMGALQTVEHDGKGGFAFAERPYVIMRDGAYVDLGTIQGPLFIEQ